MNPYNRYSTYVVCVDHQTESVAYAPINATVTNYFNSTPEINGTLRDSFKTVNFKDIDINDEDVIKLMVEEGCFKKEGDADGQN